RCSTYGRGQDQIEIGALHVVDRGEKRASIIVHPFNGNGVEMLPGAQGPLLEQWAKVESVEHPGRAIAKSRPRKIGVSSQQKPGGSNNSGGKKDPVGVDLVAVVEQHAPAIADLL